MPVHRVASSARILATSIARKPVHPVASRDRIPAHPRGIQRPVAVATGDRRPVPSRISSAAAGRAPAPINRLPDGARRPDAGRPNGIQRPGVGGAPGVLDQRPGTGLAGRNNIGDQTNIGTGDSHQYRRRRQYDECKRGQRECRQSDQLHQQFPGLG